MVLLFVSNAVSMIFYMFLEAKLTNKVRPPLDFSVLGYDSEALDMGELKYGFQTCLRLPRHVW